MRATLDRFAIFVDAGYLYAEGGKLSSGTGDRLRLRLDFTQTVSALVEKGRNHSGVSYLRTYWYDAATDATPTPSHIAVASIPGVKLRLGRLSGGRQKGVDSRIVRDLIVLAKDKAITSAYVLSGDEDIREGVAEAQDCGVSVVRSTITEMTDSEVIACSMSTTTQRRVKAAIFRLRSRRLGDVFPKTAAAPPWYGNDGG